MRQTLARIISYLFMPPLFPVVGVAYLMYINPYRYGQLDDKAKSITLIAVFALTALFPILTLLILKAQGMISNLHLPNAKERIIPYIASASFYFWAFMMFRPGQENIYVADSLIAGMLLGCTLAMFMAFFANNFTKVSIHTLGMGCLLGLVLFSADHSVYSVHLMLIASIAVAGLVGVSRLILKAHTPVQVYLGYLLGFVGQFAGLRIYPLF